MEQQPFPARETNWIAPHIGRPVRRCGRASFVAKVRGSDGVTRETVLCDIADDHGYTDPMSAVVRFLRLTVMLAFAVGIAAQTWPAATDTSRMAALHAEAMQTMDHDMGAMAESPGNADDMTHPGVLTLCEQHCTAIAIVLPASPAPPTVSARVALIAWPEPVISASIEPVPAGPPPKLRSA